MKMTDRHFAEELYLYTVNDAGLYRSMAQPIIHNYAIKRIKGIYDPAKAITGWVNLVEEGLKEYKKEFPGYYRVDKGTKLLAAKAIGNHYEEEIQTKVKKLTVLKKTGKAWKQRK